MWLLRNNILWSVCIPSNYIFWRKCSLTSNNWYIVGCVYSEQLYILECVFRANIYFEESVVWLSRINILWSVCLLSNSFGNNFSLSPLFLRGSTGLVTKTKLIQTFPSDFSPKYCEIHIFQIELMLTHLI